MRNLMIMNINVVPVILILAFPVVLFSQTSSVMNEFYMAEYENWREYIERYKDCVLDTSFDVTFYDIDVDINIDTPFIRGRVMCDFDAAQGELSSIALNLHHSLSVDSITGNVESFSTNNDTVYIDLDSTFSAGESGRVLVFYQGIPELAGGYKGLRYETHAGGEPIIATLSTPFLAHYWWPCKDGPGDKPDSVYIDIAIPDTTIGGYELVAASNGVLENVVLQGNKKIFRWRERHPIIPYYVMAAISNYRQYQQVYNGAYGESFPIDYFIFNEDYNAAVAGVEDLPLVMDLFSELFGKYPFDDEKYAMSQLGFYGGIENQTNTIIGEMSLSWFEISLHELAHMWFGDMITCRDWHHGWLNEGFATYTEALWAEYTGGFNGYKNKIQQNQFFGGGTLYLEDISNPFNIFISIIYDKGAYTLHMLRGVMGDSLFFDALKQYSLDPHFRYGHAVTEDFQGVCENVWGSSLGFFFDQWIYDEYYPMYEYSWQQDLTTLETTVRIRQIQDLQGRRPVFEMPVQLEFRFQTVDDTLVTVWNDEQVQDFEFQLSDTLTQTAFDPDNWILRTANYVSVEDEVPGARVPAFSLDQNYPNPFNPTTKISIDVPQGFSGKTSLRIYDMRGRFVITLLDAVLSAGKHTVVWDGTTGDGMPVSSGAYLYKLSNGADHQTRKMSLLK
jgi:aminopeptidase N